MFSRKARSLSQTFIRSFSRLTILLSLLLISSSLAKAQTNSSSGHLIGLTSSDGTSNYLVNIDLSAGTTNTIIGIPHGNTLGYAQGLSTLDSSTGTIYHLVSNGPGNVSVIGRKISDGSIALNLPLARSLISMDLDQASHSLIGLTASDGSANTLISINLSTLAITTIVSIPHGNTLGYAQGLSTLDSSTGTVYHLVSNGPNNLSITGRKINDGSIAFNLPVARGLISMDLDQASHSLIGLTASDGSANALISINLSTQAITTIVSIPHGNTLSYAQGISTVDSSTSTVYHPVSNGPNNVSIIGRKISDGSIVFNLPLARGLISLDALQPRTPLIFIPGVAGSTLIDPPNSNTTLWLNFLHVNRLADLALGNEIPAPDVLRGYHLPLPGGISAPGPQDKFLDDTIAGYANFIYWLTTTGGYREYKLKGSSPTTCDLTQKSDDPTLFVFPYDWTKSNTQNAAQLKQYVSCVRQLHPGTQVDVVAHSMGGLLARRYILDNLAIDSANGKPQHHIGKLITVGSPWLGAPKSILTLETGFFLDNVVIDELLGSQFASLVGRARGPQQLLPSDSYFNLTSQPPFVERGFDVDGSGNGNATEVYSHAQLVRMLDRRFGILPGILPGTETSNFHGSYLNNNGQDDFRVTPGGVQYYHIVGVQKMQATIGEVDAVKKARCIRTSLLFCTWKDSFTIGKMTYGDGTVPYVSASRLGVSNLNLNAPGAVVRLFPSLGDPPMSEHLLSHTGLLQNEKVYEQILTYLRSSNGSGGQGAAARFGEQGVAPGLAALPARYLQISGTEAIGIADDAGNTNAPVEGTPYLKPVPGITFQSLGRKSFLIVMPTDQTYTFSFRSTSEPLTLELTQGTGESTAEAIRYLDVSLPPNTSVMLKVTPQGAETLRYDGDANGTFESTVTPTASITGSAAQDIEPPSVAVSAAAQGNNMLVTIAGSDVGSGVQTIYYSLDGANFRAYSGPFTVNPFQGPVVYAFADDNVANRSGILTYYPSLTPNQIDNARFLVYQSYFDFLGRDPDTDGLNFWTNQITSCDSNFQCIEVRRINVSASFFLSIEFQQTGYLVERFYKVAYGNANGNSTFGGAHMLPVPIIRFDEFLRDSQRVGRGVVVLAPGWEQLLESNKQAYALEFVQTSRFITAFPITMTPTEFVDRLNQNAGNVLSSTERTTAINLFAGVGNSSNTTARALALRQVAEDVDLYNAEYNRAFVLAEYYGYLRRNPNDSPESTLDYTGFDFWLTKLNQFNGNYINAEMVKAFLSSIEYRQRFGP